jgi:hypothetical protein
VLRQRRGLFSGGQLFGINVSPHHGHSRRSPSTRLNSSGSIRAEQCGQNGNQGRRNLFKIEFATGSHSAIEGRFRIYDLRSLVGVEKFTKISSW